MIEKMDTTETIGIIAGVGDRREEDTKEIGAIAAEMFDEIIIRQDKHLRGRSENEIIKMLEEGIKKAGLGKKTTVIPSEKEAITHAIKNAKDGSLIVICSDVVPEALDLVTKLKEEESNRLFKFSTDEIPNR
jgi:cyanophycin synthetase